MSCFRLLFNTPARHQSDAPPSCTHSSVMLHAFAAPLLLSRGRSTACCGFVLRVERGEREGCVGWGVRPNLRSPFMPCSLVVHPHAPAALGVSCCCRLPCTRTHSPPLLVAWRQKPAVQPAAHQTALCEQRVGRVLCGLVHPQHTRTKADPLFQSPHSFGT